MLDRKLCTRQMANARRFQKHPELFKDKKIEQKLRYPLYMKFFDTRRLLTPKDSPTKFFDEVRQKNYTKEVIPPFCVKLFDNAILPNHQKAPSQVFSVTRIFGKPPLLFTENFETDKWACPETFRDTRKFQKTKEAPHQFFWYSDTVRQKVFDIFLKPPLLFTKLFAPDKWAVPTQSFSACFSQKWLSDISRFLQVISIDFFGQLYLKAFVEKKFSF